MNQKKLIPVLLAAVGLFSFESIIENNYTINGNAPGINDGEKVFLQKQADTKGFVALDSAIVKNGKFTLKGNAIEPSIRFLKFGSVDQKVVLVLEKGNINVDVYKDSIHTSKIYGTPNNVDLYGFNVTMRKYQKKMQDFQDANSQKMSDAQANKDEATAGKILNDYKAIQAEMTAASANFPETHPKSFISVLIVNNMFSDPSNSIDKIKNAFDKLDSSLKKTKTGLEIQNRINNHKAVEVGNFAPDFTAPDTNGKMTSLKSSLGKITIIDFWASWCGPCRRENPNVVALYNDFHSKGLNIISVSLDKDGAKWKEAIAKDNLTWTHVSNLKFWQDPIAELYNIKSIPATFILDAKGKIIARDLRGDELRAKVTELLAK